MSLSVYPFYTCILPKDRCIAMHQTITQFYPIGQHQPNFTPDSSHWVALIANSSYWIASIEPFGTSRLFSIKGPIRSNSVHLTHDSHEVFLLPSFKTYYRQGVTNFRVLKSSKSYNFVGLYFSYQTVFPVANKGTAPTHTWL